MIVSHLRAFLFCVSWSLFFSATFAQDAPYSQYYSNLVHLNPAFAGTRNENRINMFYRNQWPQSNAGFQSFGIAYDLPIQKINSGLGVMITNDINGGYIQPSFDLIYAYHVQVYKKMQLSFALQAGIVDKYLKPLDFSSPEPNYNTGFGKPYPDFAIGISAFYKSVYSGISVDHLTQPNQSNSNDYQVPLNRKYTLFIGHVIQLNGRLIKQERFISPNLLVEIQGMQQNICWGSSFQYDNLLGGLWLRNNFRFNTDAAIFMLGYKTQTMRFTYSYDMNIGKKTTIPLGAHEISCTFLFNTVKKKKFNAMKCPSFLM